MTNLSALPVELVRNILELLGLRGVATLASTTKRLHSISNPFLYQQDAIGDNPWALRWAAEHGQMVTFQKALKVIEDVNFADEGDRTPLHFMAYCYNETVVKMLEYLVQSNAVLDADSCYGTPLELACKNQNFRFAMALIKAGAELTDGLLASCVSSIKAKRAGKLGPDEVREESFRFQKALIL